MKHETARKPPLRRRFGRFLSRIFAAPPAVDDPLRHPALRRMTPHQLADLPLRPPFAGCRGCPTD